MSFDLCFTCKCTCFILQVITKHVASNWWEMWSLKALANVDLPIPPMPTIPRLPTFEVAFPIGKFCLGLQSI